MFQPYVNKLIENIPDEMKTKRKLDLILTGCYPFNTSFLIGSLLFLKEMEKRGYIKVCRISGNGLGSLAGLLYFSNSINMLSDYDLKILPELGRLLKDKVPKHMLKNKLFITYYDVALCVKITKSKYKTPAKLIDEVLKSCYLPFVVDGNIVYKNQFMDGLSPYEFDVKRDRQILYCSPLNYQYLRVFGNETSKVLTGILDIHGFFIIKQNTSMCSYLNEWSCFDRNIELVKYIVERIVIYLIYIMLTVKPYLPNRVMEKFKNILDLLHLF
jgi:hypothetical protein